MINYNEFIFEKNITLENANLILEKSIFSSYKEIQHNVLKKYGSQLYFIATFNSAIVSLYPIMKQIIYNSNYNIQLDTYQIVLLTIFTIAEILHVHNDAVLEIKEKLIKDGIFELVKGAKKTLFSIHKIVRIIGRTIGKTISLFVDMLAYVSILVPINDALVEILKDDGLNIESLPKKILGLGIGLGILTLKNIVIRILDKLGIHTSNELEKRVDDSMKEERENIYHNIRTMEKMKTKKKRKR